MPSTPTTRLRVETQALGENLNTWGDTRLNEALKRLEEGIAGLATIPIAGASTTLTSVNYSTDQARNACLVFTGTLTVNSVVIVPNVEKLYLAVNLTSGAFSLTLKTAAGSGYALRAGPQWVRCDGTDVSSATPRLDQAPLPTAAMDFNGQRLTNIPTTPSALTDAASKSYVDTVAGGAAAEYRPGDGTVSAPAYSFASDTDTGLYRIGADSIGVSAGGVLRATVTTTGLAVAGAISSTAGADITGAVTSSTALQAGAGAVGAPSLSFTTDPDTGLYSASANSLGFAVGGALGMTLNGSGDLGLGQTPVNNPSYRTITVGGSAGGAIELTNDGTLKGRIFLEASTDNLYVGNASADGEIYFSTANTPRMYLMSSGDFRIGQLSSSTPGISNTVTGFSLQQGGRLFSSAAGGSAFNLNGDGTVMSWARSGTLVGGVSVTTTTTTYATTSDYRLKENVEPLSNALARVALLKPSRFNFKTEPDRRVDGFLAHEAQEVCPESVTGFKDGPEMQGIDQSKLVPLLTGAVQELTQRLAALEAR